MKRFCQNCGQENELSAKFCVKCGNKLEEAEMAVSGESNIAGGAGIPVQPAMNMPVQGIFKRIGRKRLIIAGCVAAVCVLIVAGVAAGKTMQFKDYIEKYRQTEEKYPSLGYFKEEYDSYLDEAEYMASHFTFWKMGKQRQQMEELCAGIDEMEKKIATYQKDFDSVVADIEDSGKYFTGDFEDSYNSTKHDLKNALDKFDIEGCKDYTYKFDRVRNDIINKNKELGNTYIDDAKDFLGNYSLASCESYLLNEKYNKIKKLFDEEKYADEKSEYEDICNMVSRISSIQYCDRLISDYAQADVSEDNIIKLYLQSENDSVWDKDDIWVYEKENGKDTWNKCEMQSIEKVRDKGGLSIDIVADVSSSMEDCFGDMQDVVAAFARSTSDNTRLGLAELSSTYTRIDGFTDDKDEIVEDVYNLSCYGSTSLYYTLYSSVLYAAQSKGARCVIAFTDGINVPYGTGYDYTEYDVIDIAQQYKVPIYLIGIGYDVDSYVLEEIADSTGGFYDSIDVYSPGLPSYWGDIYQRIYEEQQNMYQLSYKTGIPNSKDRAVYVNYYNEDLSEGVYIEDDIEASALDEMYNNGELDAGNLMSYYTNNRYIYDGDMENLGVNDIQTIINIYYAKNGFGFGIKERIDEMVSIGAMDKNGTKDSAGVEKELKKDDVLWKNYCTFYNVRYSKIYSLTYSVYSSGTGLSKKEIIKKVHDKIGESDYARYKTIISSALKEIKENY